MATPANPDTLDLVGATDDASKGGLFNSGSNTVLTTLDASIAANVGLAQTAAADALTSENNSASSALTSLSAKQQSQTSAAEALVSKNAAAGSATNAQDWAIKTDGIVDSIDYASKAWAVGGTGVTNTSSRGASKEWAINAEDSTVDGAGYSSLHWATKAAASASTAVTAKTDAVSAKDDAVDAKNDSVTARTAAQAAQVAAETVYDNFDDRYLGAKSSDPSVDNDGNALLTGALYFNTTTNDMKVYSGSAWITAYISGANFVTLTDTQTLTNKTLTSPVIGGVSTTASGNLILDPATQILEVKGDGSSIEGQIQLNCHANSHGQIIKAQPHNTTTTNTMLLPQGANSTLVSLVSTDTLTNKTLTSPVLNTSVSGSAVLDEDNMASNSNTQLATQQSIKAYVDAEVAAVPTGDITAVIAGTGLLGGATSGSATLDIDSTVATLTGTQTFTNKTLTSPTINGGALNSVTANTQTAGTNNTTLATTAFAVTEANNAAVAMAIALG